MLAAILGLVLTSLAIQPAPSEGVGELLTRARRELSEHQYDQALATADRAKLLAPGDLTPYLISAHALLEAGRLADAGSELQPALRPDPKSPAQALELAQILDRLGLPGSASEVLMKLGPPSRQEDEALSLLVDLFYQQRRFDEAMQALDEYERRATSRPAEVQLKRGKILLDKGALEESMTAFEVVAQENPRSAAAFHGLSKVCFFGNNLEAAVEMAESAVQLEPSNGIYLYQLGSVLKASGQLDKAIPLLESARKQGADAFGITYELGDAYRKAGNALKAQEAFAEYQQLLEKKRRDQEILQLQNAGNEQLEKGRLAEARATFSRVLELSPSDWTAHNRLAKIYLTTGPLSAVKEQLDQLLRANPEDGEAHFLYALVWRAERQRDKALAEALESLRLRPGNPELRNLLGNLYFEAGKMQAAVEEYGAASRLDPANSAFRTNYETTRERLQRGP